MPARLIYDGTEYRLPNVDFEEMFTELTTLLRARPGGIALLPLDTDRGRTIFTISAGVPVTLLDEQSSAYE